MPVQSPWLRFTLAATLPINLWGAYEITRQQLNPEISVAAEFGGQVEQSEPSITVAGSSMNVAQPERLPNSPEPPGQTPPLLTQPPSVARSADQLLRSSLPIDQIIAQSFGAAAVPSAASPVKVAQLVGAKYPAAAANPVSTAQPATPGPVVVTPANAIAATAAPMPQNNSASMPASIIPATAVQSTAIDESYRLGPGDNIAVVLFNVPEYSGEQRISLDGSVNLPLLGKVPVAGRTVEEAEQLIARLYEPELQYSIVRLNLLQTRPMKITVAGEVQQPGPYVLNLGENAQLPTISQAIQSAGGLTQSANLRRVLVRRQRASGPQTIAVDLWELLQNGDVRHNLALRDGDTIVIAPTEGVNIPETAQLAASSLAATADSVLDVAVVGEIFRPGAYKIAVGKKEVAGETGGAGGTSRATVTSAIQEAGGLKPSADIRQIQVRRVTRNGREQLINLDFWKLLQGGDLSQDLVLQQGDTIIIPISEGMSPAESSQLATANLSPGTVRINVVGEVEQAGVIEMPANTTFNQAVMALGVIDNERAKEEVELVRLNPNGTISQRRIKVDVKQGINAETNPILWNNDIIIVGKSGSAKFSDQLNKILNPLRGILPFTNFLYR